MSWHRRYRELIVLVGMGLALVLGVVAIVLSLNANAATAREANDRAKDALAIQVRERTVGCDFYTAVGGFPTDQLQPTTPTGDAFKRQFVGTVEAAKLASKNLGCPSSVSTPKVP